MEDERIPDSAFTASGSYDNRHRPSLARLNLLSDGKHVGAWCPKLKSRNQWLQIDLGEITAVTKVATQGRYNSEDRTRTYTLSYSVDGLHWTSYKQRAVEKVSSTDSARDGTPLIITIIEIRGLCESILTLFVLIEVRDIHQQNQKERKRKRKGKERAIICGTSLQPM